MTKAFLVLLLVHLAAAYGRVQWQRYQQTDKEFALLESSRWIDFETSRALCASVMGYLPEPRNVGENNFVNQLSSTNYNTPLGLRDSKVEGEWRWDSDGSLVTGLQWENYTSYPRWEARGEPNGGRTENCAMILKDSYRHVGALGLKTWGDVSCDDRNYRKIVCEKSRTCHDKMGQCYFDQGRGNSLVPNVTHLCTQSVRRQVENCIDSTICDDNQDYLKFKTFMRRYNIEVCSINTVNWTDWDTTSTYTCRNNPEKELNAVKQNYRCKELLKRNDLDSCRKTDAVFACWVNDVARACSSSDPYNNYMKELQRAALRAMKATIFRQYTLPPHNCSMTIP